MDLEIFKEIGIRGKVLCVGKQILIPGCDISFDFESSEVFDWVYLRGPSEIGRQQIETQRIYSMCDRAKSVAVVYYTRQSGRVENGRVHHKKSVIDESLRDRLVSSRMFGNFYVAILSCVSKGIGFVSVEDLSSYSMELIKKIPDEVGSVVAVHRSGSIPASIISSVLHVPCHVYSKENGIVELSGGRRTSLMKESGELRLVVDDTSSSGRSIAEVKEWVFKNDQINRYVYASVFARPRGSSELDFFAKPLYGQQVLEWNFLNCNQTKNLVVDLDGVLCFDPPKFDEETQAGRESYLDWVRNAKVKYPARFIRLPAIVSYRCEYAREATEEWLQKAGVKYDSLHLFPGDPRDRTFQAKQLKGAFYKKNNYGLFVESSSSQAWDIWNYSKKPVLDLEGKKVIGDLQ